ncbi:hypothetical protein [Actinomadura nitritigenes]|uniref:hypothetical protein n=1 Tax=Actinomadura nitritigenes TaxID=134602 RepID=UPI003D8AC465
MTEIPFGSEAAWDLPALMIVIVTVVVLTLVGLAVGRALFARDPSTRADARKVLRDLLGSFFRKPG